MHDANKSSVFVCACVCLCLWARSNLIPSCHTCDASAQETVGLWEWQNCTDCETGDERREKKALLTLAQLFQHNTLHTYACFNICLNQLRTFRFIYSYIYIP